MVMKRAWLEATLGKEAGASRQTSSALRSNTFLCNSYATSSKASMALRARSSSHLRGNMMLRPLVLSRCSYRPCDSKHRIRIRSASWLCQPTTRKVICIIITVPDHYVDSRNMNDCALGAYKDSFMQRGICNASVVRGPLRSCRSSLSL